MIYFYCVHSRDSHLKVKHLHRVHGTMLVSLNGIMKSMHLVRDLHIDECRQVNYLEKV